MRSDRIPWDCSRSSLLVHRGPDETDCLGQVVAAAVAVDAAAFADVAAADDAVDATVDVIVDAAGIEAAYGFASVTVAAGSVASLSPPWMAVCSSTAAGVVAVVAASGQAAAVAESAAVPAAAGVP